MAPAALAVATMLLATVSGSRPAMASTTLTMLLAPVFVPQMWDATSVTRYELLAPALCQASHPTMDAPT